MDRLIGILPRRLLLPVGAIALAVGVGLFVQPGGLRGIDARSIPATPDNPPSENAVPCKSSQPELFRLLEPGRRLPPLSEQLRLVLATGFPGDDLQIRFKEQTRPKGTEPKLLDPLNPKTSKPAKAQGDADTSAGLSKDTSAPDDASQSPRLQATRPRADAASDHSTAADLTTPRPLPQAEGSLLLPSAPSPRRSEQLENIAQQADRLTRHGFELAGREAYFAARSEFITALRLVAQGLDAEHQTTVHSRSLAAGLTAIKEAEDFIPGGSRMEADLELAAIIGSHRTPVLKNVAPETLTPLLALKCYFTFAQEQLAAAVGHEVAGSIALHALGKLHGALARTTSAKLRAAEPKAMTFYQAALLACPQNYMAANDLGVLMAQCGNYPEARAVLEHSLSIRQPSVGWHNLAMVYRQLGQFELARRASGQAEAVRRAEQARAAAAKNPANQWVHWVDPGTFAQPSFQPPPTGQTPAAAAKAPQTSAASQRSSAARPTPAQKSAPAPQPPPTAWPPSVTAERRN